MRGDEGVDAGDVGVQLGLRLWRKGFPVGPRGAARAECAQEPVGESVAVPKSPTTAVADPPLNSICYDPARARRP
jgi:hypothetical protein